jgi:hypothetical protein
MKIRSVLTILLTLIPIVPNSVAQFLQRWDWRLQTIPGTDDYVNVPFWHREANLIHREIIRCVHFQSMTMN